MDIVVDKIEHKIDGKIIEVEFLLPALTSIPMIEVGKSWTLEQLIATSTIIEKVTVLLFGLSFCIDSIALIPSGVAAPPIPKRFAEMFMETYFLLSLERLYLPNILFIIGDRRFETFFEMPLFSSMAKRPSQIA